LRETKTLNLLLVEDDLEDERLLCEALLEIEENRQWSNWRSSSVLPVDRLADALDCLRRRSFDAVLLKLSLPDSPTLLDSFFDVNACAGFTPILVLADEADENLADRLVREGAQDVLVKSELDCGPLARAIRYAIERQRRVDAARASAFIDDLTGVLSRDAFLHIARYRSRVESLALVEISADRDSLGPRLIEAADALVRALPAPSVVGRWDRQRLCVLAAEAVVHCAAAQLANGILQFSVSSLDELEGELPWRARTAMLAD
jgi:DNA-binding response OmpR family regulator